MIAGAAAQLIRISALRSPQTSYDWAVVAVLSFALGLLVGLVKPYGSQSEGVYLGPAIVAAIVWAVIGDGLLLYVARVDEPEAQA